MLLIPDDMIEACGLVFAGEYDIDCQFNRPVILDIGANVGAFAAWAKYRWPSAIIHCYEPIASTFEILEKNMSTRVDIICHNVAVGERTESNRLMYYGGNNRGQCGFFQTPEQRKYGEYVNVISSAELPKANIIKIDTEGSEVEILAAMTQRPEVFLLEYHSPNKRKMIENMLLADYTQVEGKMGNITRGNLKYVRTDVVMASVSEEAKELLKYY